MQKRPAPTNYQRLMKAVGWGELLSEQAQAGLANASRVIGCYDGESAVGAARIQSTPQRA